MMDINAIDRFFESHPLKEHYFRFADSDRKGACAVAERDVCAAAGFMEIPQAHGDVFLAAVAEQAVFLLLNPENLTGSCDTLAAENSAGSSRSYRARQNPLCLRAAALIAPLTAAKDAVVNISRG